MKDIWTFGTLPNTSHCGSTNYSNSECKKRQGYKCHNIAPFLRFIPQKKKKINLLFFAPSFLWRSDAAAVAWTHFASCIFHTRHIANNADRRGAVKSNSFSSSFHFTPSHYLWGPFPKWPYSYVMHEAICFNDDGEATVGNNVSLCTQTARGREWDSLNEL